MLLIKNKITIDKKPVFIGHLIAQHLDDISKYVQESMEDREILYDNIYNTKLLDEILRAYETIVQEMNSMVEKFQAKDFEKNKNWRFIIAKDIAYLFNTIETYKECLDPKKRKFEHSDLYCSLYFLFDAILNDFSYLIQGYLQIQDFKEDDDSQFYSDSQTSISFVPDEEYKKIKVVARRSGFYDMRYNKVLKKEIVSIFPADDQEENINNI